MWSIGSHSKDRLCPRYFSRWILTTNCLIWARKDTFYNVSSRKSLVELHVVLRCIYVDLVERVLFEVYLSDSSSTEQVVLILVESSLIEDGSLKSYEYNGNMVGLYTWLEEKIPSNVDRLSPINEDEIRADRLGVNIHVVAETAVQEDLPPEASQGTYLTIIISVLTPKEALLTRNSQETPKVIWEMCHNGIHKAAAREFEPHFGCGRDPFQNHILHSSSEIADINCENQSSSQSSISLLRGHQPLPQLRQIYRQERPGYGKLCSLQ